MNGTSYFLANLQLNRTQHKQNAVPTQPQFESESMVIGSNNGVDSSPVMEFVIDHGRCAGVTLSENEKRQVSIGT